MSYTKKEFVKNVMNKGKSHSFDPLEYPKIRGLEGPFRFKKSGQVLYYDRREGKYYDSKTDIYLDTIPESNMSLDLISLLYESKGTAEKCVVCADPKVLPGRNICKSHKDQYKKNRKEDINSLINYLVDEADKGKSDRNNDYYRQSGLDLFTFLDKSKKKDKSKSKKKSMKYETVKNNGWMPTTDFGKAAATLAGVDLSEARGRGDMYRIYAYDGYHKEKNNVASGSMSHKTYKEIKGGTLKTMNAAVSYAEKWMSEFPPREIYTRDGQPQVRIEVSASDGTPRTVVMWRSDKSRNKHTDHYTGQYGFETPRRPMTREITVGRWIIDTDNRDLERKFESDRKSRITDKKARSLLKKSAPVAGGDGTINPKAITALRISDPKFYTDINLKKLLTSGGFTDAAIKLALLK